MHQHKRNKFVALAIGTLATVALVAGCGQAKQQPTTNPQLQAQEQAAANQLLANEKYDYASGVSAWNGLYNAKTDWIAQLKSATVQTASGKVVPLPMNKPILFVAYWCPNCHQTLQFLQKNGLLDKVQIVAVGFEFDENKLPGQYKVPSTVAEAQSTLEQAMKSIGVNLDTSKVLYGMPGLSVYPPQAKIPASEKYPISKTSVDLAIHMYPTFLVQHEGKHYVWNGQNTNAQFWGTALQGGSNS